MQRQAIHGNILGKNILKLGGMAMLMFTQVQQPSSLEEAHALMIKQKMAPVLAGGCWTRLGNRKWPMVIDLSGLGLRYIEEDDAEFRIGAMATQRDVEVYEPFQTFANGAFPKAVKDILGVQFRNMATMGGSVAARFGFSDIIPLLLALQAEVRLFEGGRMSVEAYLSYGKRDLLIEIIVPKQDVPVAIEALRKSTSDFPYLTGSARRDDSGYSVYIGCRPGKPIRAVTACDILNEKGMDALEEAVEAIEGEVAFQSNSHASAKYRLSMAKNMFKRLVKEVDTWK